MLNRMIFIFRMFIKVSESSAVDLLPSFGSQTISLPFWLNHGGFMQVVEQLVSVDELLSADEVFCTGTAVVVSPVGSITHMDKRYHSHHVFKL